MSAAMLDGGELVGKVVAVSGAASGIGRACAVEAARRGAAVVGLDIDEGVGAAVEANDYAGIRVDVTELEQMRAAARQIGERHGRLDALVLAAGVFPPSQPIAEHDPELWRRTFAVNLDGLANTLAAMHPLLARAKGGAGAVLIGSRNVLAPGPGASAYSASKAAGTQLARVAAMEWAADGIRVNVVHPDSVFDTGIWSPELIADRAESYGLSVEDYKRRNLLRIELSSELVARAVIDAATRCPAMTGAQIPVDGGNERTI